MGRALLCIGLLLSSGCGASFVPRATRVVWDPAGSDFWSLPLPSDLRRGADGGYDLESWPNTQSNKFLTMWLSTADRRLHDGWGVSSGVFMLLSGPVDPASLPLSPADSLQPDASVFLLDVDPHSPQRGRRIPLRVVQRTQSDRYSPKDLLAAIPVDGFLRRPHTTYALIVTDDVRDATGERLGRSRAFYDAFEAAGESGASPKGVDPRAVASLRMVRATLGSEGFVLARVAGAAVFTTMDPSSELLPLAVWAESLPQPTLASPWTPAQVYQSYRVLTASYEVPVIQTGQRPYANPGEGLIDWGPDGKPVVHEHQRVRLALTIPNQPQPAAGFPLTIYLHGSGGNYYQAIDRGPLPEVPLDQRPPQSQPGMGPAEWLARRGVATLGFDFPLHGDRNNPPDTTGQLFYNLLGNVDATIDNFHVAVMELLLLSRLTETFAIDPGVASGLDAGSASDGLIHIDPNRLTAMGQSMGTTIGIAWAGVDPRVRGYVFSGTGGSLVEIATGAIEPYPLQPALTLLTGLEPGQVFDRNHPLLHALQNLWDMVDPPAKAAYIAAAPRDGHTPPDVMMTAGERDSYFTPYAQAAVAVPLGAQLAGEAVEPILPGDLALAGRKPVSYPVRGNLNGHTVAVVQYSAQNDNGHYVVFNQDAARYQYTCFLASVGTGGPAVIPAPRSFDNPCPE